MKSSACGAILWAILAGAFAAQPVRAAPPCVLTEALLGRSPAQPGFEGPFGLRGDALLPSFERALNFADTQPMAARCAPGEGGEGLVVCRWDYALGAPEAAVLLDRLEGHLAACLNGAAELQRDTGVNHPDIFVASSFDLPGYRLTQSLKNKSALGRTFVTFRVHKRP